ncbi:hypothetical protein [Staphylococcus caledonicus]|uniref:hypothetical protein n=1 Tax=Staphylococcus caledonicus TaxID=2741333 RepID=UPI0018E43F09|nr:hypothetical protein [Staphylococcus caledonicus]MBI5973646.1 hypothetical protein [Staphylococcus caledonicus]
MLKNYFATPRMPIFFFYTPYTLIYLTKFIFMAQNEYTSLVSWIWNITVFILGSYTYAWLSSYILDTKENRFIRFFFAKSILFRKDFGTLAKMAYDANRQAMPTIKEERRGNKISWRESYSTYIKSVFFSFIIIIVIKYILAWILSPIFLVSIIIHPIIMKKYHQLVTA